MGSEMCIRDSIRKHGYRYTKRLNQELVLIRRVKELQGRAVASIGTLLVAAAVATGNYFSRVMYEGVTEGFGSQSWLMWVLPLLVLGGLLVLVLLLFGLWRCCKSGAKPSGKGGGRAKFLGARVTPI